MNTESTAAQLDDNMPPLDETVIDESKTAESESQVTEETATSEEAGTFVKDVDDDVQKRINQITFEKHEQKRRADAAERELKEFKANNAPPEQVEPKLEDFDYDEAAFNVASIKYQTQKGVSSAISDYKTEQQKVTANQRQTEIKSNFNARVEGFRKDAPDYDTVINGMPELPGDVFDAIMQHDKGPQLAHYLGKHLDIAESINLMKLGEISAQLANVKPTNKPSAAPDPIEPVKSGGTLNKSMDEMSMDEIYAIE